jgi:hypothetical protein
MHIRIATMQIDCEIMAQMQNMPAKWLCRRCTITKQDAKRLCHRCTDTKQACEAVVPPLHKHKTGMRNGCATIAQIQNRFGSSCAIMAQVFCRHVLPLCRFFTGIFLSRNAFFPHRELLILNLK